MGANSRVFSFQCRYIQRELILLLSNYFKLLERGESDLILMFLVFAADVFFVFIFPITKYSQICKKMVETRRVRVNSLVFIFY